MRKGLEVKDWMARNIADQLNKRCYDVDVFGVLEVREKAVKLVFASMSNGMYVAWCPKSQLIVVDLDSRDFEKKTENRKPIEADLEEVINKYKFESFSQALQEFRAQMTPYL